MSTMKKMLEVLIAETGKKELNKAKKYVLELANEIGIEEF